MRYRISRVRSRWSSWLLVCLPLGVISHTTPVTPQATQLQHHSSPTPQRLVATAPIWGAHNGFKGDAFLPVQIHGHAATLAIELNCTECDLYLAPARLAIIGVTATDTFATTWDSLSIGADVQRDVPVTMVIKPGWAIPGPESLPLVVGVVGVHFLSTHYDIVYDFPHRRVQLYAWPAPRVLGKNAWLPPGFTPRDCGARVDVPPGAGTFTGVKMQLDGHPVIGVLEMMPYSDRVTHHDEKMNRAAFAALHLPANSPRLQPLPDSVMWHGRPVDTQVTGVQLAVGQQVMWTGPVKVFPSLDVEAVLPTGTPVMLLNLTTIKPLMLFNSASSGQVCFNRPSGME